MRKVAIVLFSHAHELATGTARLAAQMAQDVDLVGIGGMPAGSMELGTDVQGLHQGVMQLLQHNEQVVILTDLGSAVLSAQTALEIFAADFDERVRRAAGPFVEGAVAAAVCAQTGGDAAAVSAAVSDAVQLWSQLPQVQPEAMGSQETSGQATQNVVLANSLGLHARPAAVLARMVADFDAQVTINGADAASILALMKLGIAGGQEVTISASGPQAEAALAQVVSQFQEGFGED